MKRNWLTKTLDTLNRLLGGTTNERPEEISADQEGTRKRQIRVSPGPVGLSRSEERTSGQTTPAKGSSQDSGNTTSEANSKGKSEGLHRNSKSETTPDPPLEISKPIKAQKPPAPRPSSRECQFDLFDQSSSKSALMPKPNPGSVHTSPASSLKEKEEESGRSLKDLMRFTPLKSEDLVLGLDFGTSTAKAVIRVGSRHYPVILRKRASKADKYLQPCVLWSNSSTACSLEKVSDFTKRHADIKTPLVFSENPKESDFVHATAFLALVLKQCKSFLARERIADPEKSNWDINIGYPSVKHDDELSRRLQICLLAAWRLASLKYISIKTAEIAVRAAKVHVDEGSQDSFDGLYLDTAVVYPEVLAARHGYLKSGHGKEDMCFVVDIGATTVDVVALCHGRTTDLSLHASVEKLGVLSLLRSELEDRGVKVSSSAFQQLAYEHVFAASNGYPRREVLEESIYLVTGCKPSELCTQQDKRDELLNACTTQAATAIMDVVRRGNPNHSIWQKSSTGKLYIYLIGGGSRIDFYKEIELHLINRFGSNYHWGERIKCADYGAVSSLNGLTKSFCDIHRMAVAFGLSHSADDLRTFVSLEDAGPIKKQVLERDGREYIGAEQM